MRRNESSDQLSIYVDYRMHVNPGIHDVQDYIIQHLDQNFNIDQLAEFANMSKRNLTRLFKKFTGITIMEFTRKVKLELASKLLHNPSMSIESISESCGFESSRNFGRVWKSTFGESPQYSRSKIKSKMI